MDETVLPPELKEANRQTWLQMTVVAAGLVFALDLVANFISFSTRFVSALGTAVLFLAGHSTLSTTQRYIEADAEAQRRVVDLV